MVKKINNLKETIFSILCQMDDEANTKINGIHAGLCDYAAHCGIQTKKYEDYIYWGLANHLMKLNYSVEPDQPYGDGTKRECDLEIQLESQEKIIVEVKLVWKEWFSSENRKVKTNKAFYESYLFYPFRGKLKRPNSVALDFEKLETIPKTRADYIAELLIGFEHGDRPISGDVVDLEKLLNLKKKYWHSSDPEIWLDRNCPVTNRSCWFWWKEVDKK